jgi:predicted enzyme related to lactoylglutathione lyase
VPIIKRDDDDTFGRFAWIQDPDGTKIELWQPKRSVSTHGSA